MFLTKLFQLAFQTRSIALVSTLWIGLQLKGYYWVLILVLFCALSHFRESIPSYWLYGRQLLLLILLFIFSFSLFASVVIDSGFIALPREIPVTLPLLPMFILSGMFLGSKKIGFCAGSSYCYHPIMVVILIIVGALWEGFLLSTSPDSSLRPYEIQASSGIFFLTALAISQESRHSIASSKYTLKSCASRYILLSVVVLSMISFICFRGITSASALLSSTASLCILYLVPRMHNYGGLKTLILSAVFVLGVSRVLDFRFFVLKYIVSPFVSHDIANGRLNILRSWIVDYSGEPIRLIGSQPNVPVDFFAHNLILDSMIKSGLIPAATIFLFCTLSFVYLLRDCLKFFDKYRFLNLFVFCLLAIPSLLQPVQYSNAFAFLLAISTVAILTSMSTSCPPLQSPKSLSA